MPGNKSLDGFFRAVRRYAVPLTSLVALSVAVGSILALLGRWYWLFELTTHFRLQFFAILSLCGLVLAGAKYYTRSIVAAALAVVNLAVVAPWRAGEFVQPTPGKSLRIATINVYHGNEQYSEVIQFAREIDADLLLFTEVDADWASALRELESDFYCMRFLQTEPILGVMVCSRYPLLDMAKVPLAETDSTALQATIDLDGRNLTVFGTHTWSPKTGLLANMRNRQLSGLARLAAAQAGPTMLLGDLNASPWSPFFQDLLTVSGLRDSRTGFGYQGTWPAGFLPLRIPIDHCLVSPQIAVRNRQVQHCPGSDHLAVIVEIDLPEATTSRVSP